MKGTLKGTLLSLMMLSPVFWVIISAVSGFTIIAVILTGESMWLEYNNINAMQKQGVNIITAVMFVEEIEEAKVSQQLSVANELSINNNLKTINGTDFVYPLEKFLLTSKYGWRSLGGWNMHGGTDFAAPKGTPIYSVYPAEVAEIRLAGSGDGGWGNMVLLKHTSPAGLSFFTRYAHMSEPPTKYVSLSQKIKKGQQIGVVGSTGDSTGNHLHFELFITSAKSDGIGIDENGIVDAAVSQNKEIVNVGLSRFKKLWEGK